jgi:hypothetical protein
MDLIVQAAVQIPRNILKQAAKNMLVYHIPQTQVILSFRVLLCATMDNVFNNVLV